MDWEKARAHAAPIRTTVFVDEQRVPAELEMDEKDAVCVHAIAFLDATVPLRRAVAAGTSVYLPDDVHWNPAGHRVVAAAVADSLHQMGTPPAGAFGASK